MLHAKFFSDRALLRWGYVFVSGVVVFAARHWIPSAVAVYLGVALMAPLPLILLCYLVDQGLARFRAGRRKAGADHGGTRKRVASKGPGSRRASARRLGGAVKGGFLKLPAMLRVRRVAELPGMDMVVLRSGLIELGSRKEQERLWLGQSEGELSYFDEAVTQTFEDSGLLEAVESGLLEQRYPATAVAAIDGLSRAVEAVPSHLSQAKIIADPAMEDVRRWARTLLGLTGGATSNQRSA